MSEIYNELNKIDVLNNSIPKIESTLSDILLGHNRITLSLSPSGLFRARKINNVNEDELSTPKCIWYPDWSKIDQNFHRYGRLNDRGQNFFYGSNNLETVIRELRPNQGDKILIGIFHMKYSYTKLDSQFAGIDTIRKTNQFNLLQNFEYKTKRDEDIEHF